MAPAVTEWLEGTEHLRVWAFCEWAGVRVDIGVSKYADDLARKLVARTAGEAHRHHVQNWRALAGALEKRNFKQNYDKDVIAPALVGQ